MKITEKQLRKLIREAYKEFFYAVGPSSTINDVYANLGAINKVHPNFSKLFIDPDDDKANRQALNLLHTYITGNLNSNPQYLQNFPPIVSKIYQDLDTDIDTIERGQQPYQDIFSDAESSGEDHRTKTLFKRVFEDTLSNHRLQFRPKIEDSGDNRITIETQSEVGRKFLEDLEAELKKYGFRSMFGVRNSGPTVAHSIIARGIVTGKPQFLV